MKLRAINKERARNELNYRGHWIVSGDRGLTLGAKHITEEQAHDCNLIELSKVREWLGPSYAVDIRV